MGNAFVVRSRTLSSERENNYGEDIYESNNNSTQQNKQRIAKNQPSTTSNNSTPSNSSSRINTTPSTPTKSNDPLNTNNNNSNSNSNNIIVTNNNTINNNGNGSKSVNIVQQSSPSNDSNTTINNTVNINGNGIGNNNGQRNERSSSTTSQISQMSTSKVESNTLQLLQQIDEIYKEIDAWEQVPNEYKIGIHNLYKKIKKRYLSTNSIATPNELSLKKHSIRIGSPLHFYKYFNVQLKSVKEMIYQEYLNDLNEKSENSDEDSEESEIPTMEEYFSQNVNEIKFKKPLKVKLIISDLNQPKLASKMASTVNSFVNVFSQFGWVHTAFSISNLKFDWVKSEYCETGDVKGTSCLLAITVKEILDLNELENCLKILSEEVSKWNREYSYGSVTNDKKLHSKKIANCQDFTIYMLQKIGVKDLKFENTSIGDYLESVFNKGLIDIVFTTNKEFRDKYNLLFKENSINRIVEKKHTFPSHKDLDLFVHDFFKVDSTFEQTEECQLLKAFDRGFWLKYRKSCQQSQYDDTIRNEPLQIENHEHGGHFECACPFGDPQDSYSLLIQPNLKR